MRMAPRNEHCIAAMPITQLHLIVRIATTILLVLPLLLKPSQAIIMKVSLRRSARLMRLSPVAAAKSSSDYPQDVNNTKHHRKTSTTKKANRKRAETLPRSREEALMASHSVIIGIDEAGRGPLAGPVVAAAIICPTTTTVDGITDSKKITKEEERNELFEKLTSSPNIRYAVAVVDAEKIDEINILQATYLGMRMTAAALVLGVDHGYTEHSTVDAQHEGCYLVTGGTDTQGRALDKNIVHQHSSNDCFALIDGNRTPPNMPCESETMVKGDSREYCIGAASILAKVARDRLMHQYDQLYPNYLLHQHKGYPTAKHMALVQQFGASPIHRKTFAPLKHWEFDSEGNIIGEKKKEEKKKRKKSS